jgi:hypothetical protein
MLIAFTPPEARRVGVIPCNLDGALAYKRALAGE